MKEKSIAVLLTVFNRKVKTLKCLDKVFKQNYLDNISISVILVDDGCSDGTSLEVKRLFPQVEIIYGGGDLYWNRGMHLAWKSALEIGEFDFYLWLNDDTLLFEDSLRCLVDTSAFNSDVAIIVGTTCSTSDEGKITYGGRLESGALIKPNGYSHRFCDYFNGNIVLVPSFVFRKVGMNDPIFHHSLGDFDYGLRAKSSGIPLVVSSKVLGYCDTHESLPTWCNPEISFWKRWKVFRTPLGNNPEEYFAFERRHKGIFLAVFHYFTNHLRVLVPFIWKMKERR